MKTDYIIVQAGGKGTRMEYLTTNKPKSLVPVHNLPMLFHLFRKYPDKKFIIIGDYKYDVLNKYLKAFADVKYLLVDARGYQGTCAGLSKAIKLIPDKESFMLIWSDLILPKEFEMPTEDGNYLGLSGDFRCRWKYENGEFEEEPSVEHGVAGLFVFKDKEQIINVPAEGEFVRWLKETGMKPRELVLSKTKEYGLISEYKKLVTERCRPFNKMTVDGDKLIKEGIDEQGRKLAVREKAWYKFVEPLGFTDTPKIYSYEPFVMEKVAGKNIFEYELTREEKSMVLERIVNMLKKLHSIGGEVPTDYFSMQEAYADKTFDRLEKIRDLVPFANQEFIEINGRKCRNVFFYKDLLEEKLSKLDAKSFVLLHGDCTFCNMMLRDEDLQPLVIDPRGYFGYTEMYGDVAYDWAKLYYSIVGNYDRFNVKDFRLGIDDSGDIGKITLEIGSNGWEELEEEYLSLIADDVIGEQLKLIHAVIWLSLTTYAWEDYDSICGAFYNGLYYLEEVL
ncbi:MAG: phosphotransferase [Lachnospiraceae bacterium]|nr:phosphotransferase [Lachnospiraceae bacterium]